MDHLEIRFRLLLVLYNEYYRGQFHQTHAIDRVVEEAGLQSIDNMYDVYGDIIYLIDSFLIDYGGFWPMGRVYPPMIRITEDGISYVENIFDNFFQEIEKSDISVETKIELTKVISQCNSKNAKVKGLWEYVKLHPGVFVIISETLIKLMTTQTH
jgi:hypothetical protein